MAGLPNPLAVGGDDSTLKNGQSYSLDHPLLSKLAQAISMLGVSKQAAGKAVSRIPKDTAADVGISPTPMGYLSGPVGKQLTSPERLNDLVKSTGLGSWSIPKRLLGGVNSYLEGGFSKQLPLNGGHVLFSKPEETHDLVASMLGFGQHTQDGGGLASAYTDMLNKGGVQNRANYLFAKPEAANGKDIQNALHNLISNDPYAMSNNGKSWGQLSLGQGAPYTFADVGEKEIADPNAFMSKVGIDLKDKKTVKQMEEWLYNFLSGQKTSAAGR